MHEPGSPFNSRRETEGDPGTLEFCIKMFNHLAEFPYIPKAARGFLTAAGPSCLDEGIAVGDG